MFHRSLRLRLAAAPQAPPRPEHRRACDGAVGVPAVHGWPVELQRSPALHSRRLRSSALAAAVVPAPAPQYLASDVAGAASAGAMLAAPARSPMPRRLPARPPRPPFHAPPPVRPRRSRPGHSRLPPPLRRPVVAPAGDGGDDGGDGAAYRAEPTQRLRPRQRKAPAGALRSRYPANLCARLRRPASGGAPLPDPAASIQSGPGPTP
jgi:hypothetical protein